MAEQVQYYGTGRRKSSIARVFLRPGSGKFTVNDREFERYFVTEAQRVSAKSALVSSETGTTFDVVANVHGGGVNGQADAVKMGPGTLYGSLDRMIEAGLVAKGNTQDPRRIYYRLTALGQTTSRAETERLSRVARVARRQIGTT